VEGVEWGGIVRCRFVPFVQCTWFTLALVRSGPILPSVKLSNFSLTLKASGSDLPLYFVNI